MKKTKSVGEEKINKSVRKENYERGMKYGEAVYCGQDLRDFIGMTIRDISSDDIDANVIMWLEEGGRSVALYFDDLCFDGERIKIVDLLEESTSTMLRPITEADLKEISEMKAYYDIDVLDDDENKIGVNHMYCNDIGLEGTAGFKVKRLYVFHNGNIMTQRDV